MIVARAQWLSVAVTYAATHAAPARRQLADHLDALAHEQADRYFAGLADSVRGATVVTRQPPQMWIN